MNLGKFRYSKESGNKEENSPHPVSRAIRTDEPGVSKLLDVPSHYSKEEGRLTPCLICVISGGTDRERDLLTEIEKRETFNRLNVIFLSSKTVPSLKEGGLTPKMMKDFYDRIQQRGKINLKNRLIDFKVIDKVFLFTDVDHYYDELTDIFSSLAKKERDEWIVSNPCIEIWIYYCYRDKPEDELHRIIETKEDSKRSSLLKFVNGTFNNGGGLDTRKTFENLETGISNSIKHYKEDINGIPELLSTQMHRFALEVLNVLDDEYREWKKRLNEIRNRFRPH